MGTYGRGAETRTTYGHTSTVKGEDKLRGSRTIEWPANPPVEHVDTTAIEIAAANADTLHLLQCSRCAGLVIKLAQTLETTPLDQYPQEY